jgi:hypothetical protein
MGRWFGYRPGYADLCRLYTTTEMTTWFSHIAAASIELREDFDRMAASGGTPRDFGLRVRSHPTLLVTSQVKMRSGWAMDVTFEGTVSETINFWRSAEKLQNNWDAGVALIGSIGEPETQRNGALIWRDLGQDPVIAFLEMFREHPASVKVRTPLLAEFIRAENQESRLTEWTIMVASGSGGRCDIASHNTQFVQRRWHLADENSTVERQRYINQDHYRIRRLLSPSDELVDLSPTELQAAMAAARAEWQAKGSKGDPPDKPGGVHIRQARPSVRGLLLLYPLDGSDGKGIVHSKKVQEDARAIPVLGFGISFPFVAGGGTSRRVTYVVNNTYYKQEFGDPEPA